MNRMVVLAALCMFCCYLFFWRSCIPYCMCVFDPDKSIIIIPRTCTATCWSVCLCGSTLCHLHWPPCCVWIVRTMAVSLFSDENGEIFSMPFPAQSHQAHMNNVYLTRLTQHVNQPSESNLSLPCLALVIHFDVIAVVIFTLVHLIVVLCASVCACKVQGSLAPQSCFIRELHMKEGTERGGGAEERTCI